MMAATPARIRVTVWGLVIALVAMIAVATGYQIWNAYRQALAESQAQAVRFVAGAESAFNRSLLGIDVLLAGTDEFLGLSTTVAQWVDPEVASQLLRSASNQSLTVRFVALVDDKGKLFASSEPVGARLERVFPQAFIDQAMAQPMSTLVISAPVDSVASMERVLYFGRYIRMADGSNLLAVAEVPTALLATVLMQGTDIAGLEVTLERGNGQLLLGVPNPEARSDLVRNALRGAGTGAAGAELSRARLSDVPALVVSRPLLYRDLWISASIPLDAALSKWRFDRNVLLIAALLFISLLLTTGGFVVNYLRSIAAARLAIAQSKMTLDQALESMVSGFVLLDAEQRVVQWNRRFVEIFPWMAGIMAVGMPFRQVLQTASQHQLPGATAAERAQWVEARLLAQIKRAAVPHEQILPSGEHIEITERLTPESGMVITYHDVSAVRKASAEIETLAFYDALTGLPNRRLLLEQLRRALHTNARHHRHGALLFIDLDNFKTLNDTLGHDVGDLLLQQVGQRLTDCVRESDTVARLGGDEFVLVLEDLETDPRAAALQADSAGKKILATLNQPYDLAGREHHSSPSMGITLFDARSTSVDDLLKQADLAMYQAKAAGRNTLRFFDVSMQTELENWVALEFDLRDGLQGGEELVLYFQPTVGATGQVTGAEALVRWLQPTRGLVVPENFIALAESTGLIVPLGRWVMNMACQQLATWALLPNTAHLSLAVNVSARELSEPGFVAGVLKFLALWKVRPNMLRIELTESVLAHRTDDIIGKMKELKARGVGFSLDDFGTGYSSLSYLKQLPLDLLKIDRSFVRDVLTDANDAAIARTIVALGTTLGLSVVAEGVETEEQRDFLASIGCYAYQGFLFGRPVPIEEFSRFLSPPSSTAHPFDA